MADRVHISIACHKDHAPLFEPYGFSVTLKANAMGTVVMEDDEGVADESRWPDVEFVGCHAGHYEFDGRIFCNEKQPDGTFVWHEAGIGVDGHPTFALTRRADGVLDILSIDLQETLASIRTIDTRARSMGLDHCPGLFAPDFHG